MKKRRLILSQAKDLNLDFISEEGSEAEQIKKNPKSGDETIILRAVELYTKEGYSQQRVGDILRTEFGDKAPSHGTLSGKILKGHKRGQSKKEKGND